MKKTSIIILIFCALGLTAQNKKSSIKQINTENSKTDSVSSASSSKEFSKISSGAICKKGLFNGYITKNGNYYIEIPDSLLGRDMLLAARVVNISDNSKISAGQMRSNPVLISFSKRDKLIFMHQPTGSSMADADDLISVSLARNNVTPIAQTFDMACRNERDDASLVDVTKFFSAEVDLVFPAGAGNSGRLDTKASQILELKSFPQNVEIKSFYNYSGGKTPFCITINYSFVLLPKTPMKIRFADDRIGYSSENRRKYESEKPVISQKYIDRWRIEPSAKDLAKYKRGDLVVPQKQIIVYVDTVMPSVWRKYVRQGIEDWNIGFKEIGFKNVIVAKDYPRSRDFDSEDIRNTCFRYITSTDANASGPQWIDPRSGEIIQADILWWHNVIDLLQTWKFVQTAAVDPEARKKTLDEKVFGEMIRYAVAHETGHVFGIIHNMRGSYAYPTESLRSAEFTKKYGTTASIMDYARFNYVAQPGDVEKGVSLTPPVMGPYDIFAIKYAYKPIYEAKTPEEEVPVLNQWFVEKGNNPFYIFSPAIVSPVAPDPSSQTDALGDDQLKSSQYGISNLKITAKNLVKWTISTGDDLELLQKRFDGISKLYNKLVNLTISYLGGVYTIPMTYGQFPATYTPIEKSKQKETIRFAIGELNNCEWLDTPELNQLLGSKTEDIMKFQSGVITSMLSNFVLGRIISSEKLSENESYTIQEYLADVDAEIWTKTANTNLTNYKKNMQIVYVDKLRSLVSPVLIQNDKSEARSMNETLSASAASVQLESTVKRITELQKNQPQNAVHYQLLLKMIEKTN